MKRTEVTYGHLDKVLHSLGFSCRLGKGESPARVYEHKESGASIFLPSFPLTDFMYEHHLLIARMTVDQYGITDPKLFDDNMNRTDVTYGQLDDALRSLGFSCRVLKKEPPARVYEHKESGALLPIPPCSMTDFVLDYHLFAARTILDWFGIADPKVFDAKLRKAG